MKEVVSDCVYKAFFDDARYVDRVNFLDFTWKGDPNLKSCEVALLRSRVQELEEENKMLRVQLTDSERQCIAYMSALDRVEGEVLDEDFE